MHSYSIRKPVRRTVTLALVGTTALLSLTACGGSSSGSGASDSSPSAVAPAASGAHNAADVTFATGMIPHHAQAVEMAGMASSKAVDADVKALAGAIAGAQQPEINSMTSWLIAWKAPVPSTGSAHMDMGSGAMPGMMSTAEMAELDAATGAEFDKMWIEMMTKHHEGAIEMARTELANGQNSDAKALASQIIKAQTAEIAKMATIAKRLG